MPESTLTSHRAIEWFGVEGTLQGHLVPLPAMHGDTHSSISAHSPSPDLGCLQGWGILHKPLVLGWWENKIFDLGKISVTSRKGDLLEK